MKHLKLVFIALLAIAVHAQTGTYIAGGRTIGGFWDASAATKTKMVKVVAIDPSGSCPDNNAWEWNPTTRRLFACGAGTWYKMADAAGLGGGVSSFATRTGAVVADGTDYASFYPMLSGSYSNPAWIATLAGSKLTGSVALSLLAQTSAITGQVIQWSGSAWVPASASATLQLKDSTGSVVGSPRAALKVSGGLGILPTLGDDGTNITISHAIDPTYVVINSGAQAGTALNCPGSGSAGVQTCNLNPALQTYSANMVVQFIPGTTNSTTQTININSLGARSILTFDGAALGASDLTAARQYAIWYDGTAFRLPKTVSGGGGTKQLWFTFGMNDTNGAKVSATSTNTATAITSSANEVGTVGVSLPVTGTPEARIHFTIPTTLSTISVTPDALLQGSNTGLGTFQVQVAAACVPAGGNRLTPTYSTFTSTTTSISANGLSPASPPTHVITPGGTCSARATVLVRFRRDKTGSGAGIDTAVDSVSLTGVLIEY